jgi:hypothetical protein
MEIKNLFDPSKDIYRTIEKVITYGAAQEQRLKSEISEYIVTDRDILSSEILTGIKSNRDFMAFYEVRMDRLFSL